MLNRPRTACLGGVALLTAFALGTLVAEEKAHSWWQYALLAVVGLAAFAGTLIGDGEETLREAVAEQTRREAHVRRKRAEAERRLAGWRMTQRPLDAEGIPLDSVRGKTDPR